MVAYAAESPRSKPTHGGTASMPTFSEKRERKNEINKNNKNEDNPQFWNSCFDFME
jgi:hypothetical protein